MPGESHYCVGQLVSHNKFNYRGVVIDVDHRFMLSEEWYDNVAKSRPPKDQPWYRVLVHDAEHQTYVAERHLNPDSSDRAVHNPDIARYFLDFKEGRYVSKRKAN